jgi:hypothetical protein
MSNLFCLGTYSIFTHYEIRWQFVETRFLKETWFLLYLLRDENAIIQIMTKIANYLVSLGCFFCSILSVIGLVLDNCLI